MATQENIQIEQPLENIEKNFKEKGTIDVETDSGVDNSSDSGNSCDCDHKPSACCNSTESLDEAEPPFVKNSNSIRLKCADFIECEKRTTVITYDLQPEFRQKTVETVSETDSHPAVLDPENSPDEEDSVIDFDLLPPYFQDLWLGKNESCKFDVPLLVKPLWYNEDKFRRGQKFAQNHLFCINFAETLSLFLIFSLKSAIEPLIFTGRSDSPFKACQRYLSTLTRIMSWYEGDLWEEGGHAQRHLAAVRIMHRNVQHKLSQASPEEIQKKTTLGSDGSPVWCTARQFLLEDFRSACPVPAPGTCPHIGTSARVNQFDMSITQFAFVGLAVTYPNKFGIHFATDEDLDGFIHMWRTLGHLLGIEDKYNYCNTNLEGVRQRTYDFINMAIKPSLRNVTVEWEHMSRCLVQGIAFYVPGFNFDVSLKYLCNVLKIHTPRLTKSLTLWQSFMLRTVDFTFNVLCRIPGLLTLYNKIMLRAIRRAQSASPRLLSKWEKTEFPYMKEKVPIKAV